MGELTEAVLNRQSLRQARRPDPQAPKGWEPGVTWDGSQGVYTTAPTTSTQAPELRKLLEEDGLDPDRFEVVGNVRHSKWQSFTGDWLHAWRYHVAEVSPGAQERASEVRSLVDTLLSGGVPAAQSAPPGAVEGDWFFFVVADTQAGKPDGDGTEGMVRRFHQAVENAKTRVLGLRAMGHDLRNLALPCLGDLVENCDGYYAQQTFRVELNHRDQRHLMRGLLLYALKELAPLFERVTVLAVPGNHGERRLEGKSYTDFADNDDVALVEDLAWAVKLLDELAPDGNPLGHVSFVIPEDELDVTLDFAGTLVTFAHGHQFRAKKVQDCEAKAESWWARMAHTRQNAGDSTLLLSGHFHHLRVIDFGPKVWLQAPALDGGSDWFAQSGGGVSRAGILTLTVGGGTWGNTEVL